MEHSQIARAEAWNIVETGYRDLPGAVSRHIAVCRGLDDAQLLGRLKTLVACENRALALVLALIAEVDRRKLHEPEGYSSLFWYCVKELGYSEDAAARRIHVARIARNFPELFSMLADGSLTLTAASIIAPHLTEENHADILGRAQRLTKREAETLIAGVAPRPDAVDAIRRLKGRQAEQAGGGSVRQALVLAAEPLDQAKGFDGRTSEESRSPIQTGAALGSNPVNQNPTSNPKVAAVQRIVPLSPQRFKVTFTASGELIEDIERARGLIRHKHPEGRLEKVFEEMVDCYLERHDPDRRIRRRHARQAAAGSEYSSAGARPPSAASSLPSVETSPPPSGSSRSSSTNASSTDSRIERGIDRRTFDGRQARERRIPQAVKDAVWTRDGGRCAFISQGGRRCEATAWLEFDHIRPWALGGVSGDPANIRLLCRAHNQMEARRVFGKFPGDHLNFRSKSGETRIYQAWTACRRRAKDLIPASTSALVM